MARSKLLSTAYQLIDGFNDWTEEGIFDCRTDDCVHKFWPAKDPSSPGNSNEVAKQHFRATKNVFQNFHVDVVEEAEDPARKRVVFLAHAEMDTPEGGKISDYTLIVDMNETEDKIKRIIQFTQMKDKEPKSG